MVFGKKNLNNTSENRFITEAEFEEAKVYKNGWPDFAVETKRGAIYFVEVKKDKNSPLTSEQKEMFKLLRKLGIHTMISRGGKWIEPSVITDPTRYIVIENDIKYYLNKLNNLNDQILMLKDEIEHNLKIIAQVERQKDEMDRLLEAREEEFNLVTADGDNGNADS